MPDFYSIPFSFQDLLTRKNDQLKVPTETSIRQHISLIITTQLGDFRFDPTYGCKIWEVDFVVPSNLNAWKDEIKVSLEQAIRAHEHRIEFIDRFVVKVERGDPKGEKRIHQRLEIEIEGKVRGSNKVFTYSENLYFSPVSLI
ncbi:MAG: GPW/gp25 family protein [Bacteroidota bacterium]